MTKYNMTPDEWNAARTEMTQVLVACAREGKFIAYSDLAARVQAVELDPHGYAMGKLLEEISTQENSMGRGMLTVLVVHKHGEIKPGKGFFELAARLGKVISDEDQCMVDEYEAVIHYWKNH